jgi:hypothetical protein
MATSLWTGLATPLAPERSFKTGTVACVPIRYRCNACGNLTRFDVVETTTVRSFHHYTVGGELTIEEPEVISHSVEQVTCRWCGHGRGVEEIRDDAI